MLLYISEGSREGLIEEAYRRYMLEEKGVLPEEPPKIERSGNGKPFFAGDGYPCFSLSHSGVMNVILMADFPVGVDIEEHSERHRGAAVAERFFSGLERTYTDIYGEEAFYRIWTRKEAAVKLTDGKLLKTLSEFSVLDENGEFSEETELAGRRVYLGEIEIGRGISLSYAADRAEEICLRLIE